jgi:anaerobic selenocysteine-containing dehydrogenase
MGGNPQASGGSLLACPDVLGELDAIRARGGKVIVVDPRRTGTADHADEWVPILPGTDAAFLLAMCNVLFAEGLTTLGALEEKVKGVDTVRELCADFTPESVEAFCRVPADTIRRLAREFAAAPSGAVYGRIGLCNQEFGTLASWLVDVVNIVVGKFDRPGGLMWGKPINWPMAWMASTAKDGAPRFGRWKSRVSGVPEVLGQVPAAFLAEEIATPGDGQIKALFTVAGNPVISVPDSARLEAALPELECMISVDNYLNETTRFAHVILPGPSPLESPHYDEVLWSWAARSAGNWSDAI